MAYHLAEAQTQGAASGLCSLRWHEAEGRADRAGCVARKSAIVLFLISALTSLFTAIWRGCRGPAAVAETHRQAPRGCQV